MGLKRKSIKDMSRPQVTRSILKRLERRYADPDMWTQPYTEIQPGCRFDADSPVAYRVDFVVFRKRWNKCESIGVEIKSCRADFTSDKKWQQYTHHFTRFYFAAPVGAIKPEELPDEVGLLTWSGTEHLRTAKAAYENMDRRGADNQDNGLLMACIFRR